MWSFLMASAHGAGLMLFPVLIIDGVCQLVEKHLASGHGAERL
jgi:hypothetical protein